MRLSYSVLLRCAPIWICRVSVELNPQLSSRPPAGSGVMPNSAADPRAVIEDRSTRRVRPLLEPPQLVADLLPRSATVTPRDRILLGRGVVAAADELLLAWLDNDSNVSREDVVELVMVFFDAVADSVRR
jgi:hypothetical protein